MSHEGSSGIHKHTYKDRNHGKWHYINVQNVVYYHHRCDYGKQHNQRIYHGSRPYLLEIIFSEKGKEYCETGKQYCCV